MAPPTPEAPQQRPTFKTTIVFGQGAVKPVVLDSELSPEQKKQWAEFKQDPLRSTEPEFRVLEGTAFTSQITEIENRTDLTDSEKKELIEVERNKWQHMGRFALNRWGRQNALAAGALLVAGDTKDLILSGGKTKPKEVGALVPQTRLEKWPSEAELMKDIIVARFGAEFSKKYGKDISEFIKIEDASTNTLENFAYTINNSPNLIGDGEPTGLLGTDFHIKRIAALSHLFSVQEADGGQLGSQQLLKDRAQGRARYEQILKHMTDAENNEDLQVRNNQERHWSKELDVDLAYWLGYFGYVKSPRVIQQTIDLLRQPRWVKQAETEFAKVGLDFSNISGKSLVELEEQKPEEFGALRASLVRHVKEHRAVPPIPPLNK